jgi:hypothetical protein
MGTACENCAFAFVNKYGRESGFAPPDDYYATLQCRRYPPGKSFNQSNVSTSEAEAWPTVAKHWWCGEFKGS